MTNETFKAIIYFVKSEVKKSETYTQQNGRINYSASESTQLCRNICQKFNALQGFKNLNTGLKCEYKENSETQIIVSHNTGAMTLNLTSFVDSTELDKMMSEKLELDYKKYGFVSVNWEAKKIARTHPKTRPGAKEYWHELKAVELAELFESKEEFMNCTDRLNIIHNLETAQKSGNKKMEKMWSEHLQKWNEAEKIEVDYELVKKHKAYELEVQNAKNNEAVQWLKKNLDLKWMSHLEIYNLYRNLNMEPVEDAELYKLVLIANDLKYPENSHQYNSRMKRFNNGLPPAEKYLQSCKIELHDLEIDYKEKFYKQDGIIKKKIDRRKYVEYNGRLRSLKNEIEYLEFNLSTLNKMLE